MRIAVRIQFLLLLLAKIKHEQWSTPGQIINATFIASGSGRGVVNTSATTPIGTSL